MLSDAAAGTTGRLPATFQQRLSVPATFLGDGYGPCNVSIQTTPSGYVALIRLSTHRLNRLGRVYQPRPIPCSIARLVLVTLDHALRQTGIHEVDTSLLDDVTCRHVSVAEVYGLEDPRLFRWDDRLWFTATAHTFRPWHTGAVALARLDPSLTRVDHLVPLEYERGRSVEKNWLPFLQDGRLRLIYSSNPTVILEADPDTGACRELHRSHPAPALPDLRGSGPPLRLGERYLYTTHEVSFTGRRIDYQHFIELDATLRISRVSPRFCFREETVEYSCGLCLAHDGTTLLLSWSYRDSECWIAGLPLADAVALLRPVDE